ncbi:MAG: diacylglycerol kinase family lipid kinase [Calditrichaeota bacterium]|nr:MAG: diacylglycerol kinase family lipid kinase [Calditrichota bacterium]
MKLLMLVNPLAGRKQGEQVAQQSLDLFRQRGIKVEHQLSEYAGHLTELAERQVSGDWDGIVVVGGDGSLFEVINGMMRGNEQLPIPLGVIPVGTGNSFSRDLAIQNPEQAVEKIIGNRTRRVDLGMCQCEDQLFYFINILGFGFVSDVAQKASYYKRWGSLSYVIGVFIITAELESYHLEFEIDGQTFQRDNIFVEISNSTKTGGDMLMAPQAKIDDGYLDVVLLNKISRLGLLSALPKIFKGTHLQMKQVETFKAQKMVFRPESAKVLTPDGEIIGKTPISVAVLPGKIRVFD